MLPLACLKAADVKIQFRAQSPWTRYCWHLCVCLENHFQIKEVTELKICKFVIDATKLILSEVSPPDWPNAYLC